jgi:pyrophosphatase PpaX
MLATYLEYNFEQHDRMVRSYPGMTETVSRLRDDGYALGIVTSKQRKGTLRGLRSCDLPEEWFGSIVTADDVSRGKPDPEPLRMALLEMEEEPGRAVYIGDSIHDILAGGAAGTLTAAALWGPYDRESLAPARPDYWLDRIEDVWALLA